MTTVREVLVKLVWALVVGVAVYGIVWWGAHRLGQSDRQAEGWAWIAVIVTMLSSGLVGHWWIPRPIRRSDAISPPGSSGGPERRNRR